MNNINFVVCNSELGAGTRGASLGPEAIRISAFTKGHHYFNLYPAYHIPTPITASKHAEKASIDYLSEFIPLYENVHYHLGHLLNEKDRQLIFSGDHSNAGALVGAVKNRYPDQKIGLIWIDAHGDLHTPYTSPSGNVHGMPVGNLLGIDNAPNKTRELTEEQAQSWEKLKKAGSANICPKMNPEDIYFIDLRDLEQEEWDLINHYQIKHFTPQERGSIGIETIVDQVRQYFKDYDQVYVSFDVDSLDGDLAQGTGTPVKNGLSYEDAEHLLKAFWQMPNCNLLEFTEVNPLLDARNKVADHVTGLLSALIGD